MNSDSVKTTVQLATDNCSLITGHWIPVTERGGCFWAGLGYNWFMFHLSIINENIDSAALTDAYTPFGGLFAGKKRVPAARERSNKFAARAWEMVSL